MSFTRGKDIKSTIGIGLLGKRGVTYEHPWLIRFEQKYHVKAMAHVLGEWAKHNGQTPPIIYEDPPGLYQCDHKDEEKCKELDAAGKFYRNHKLFTYEIFPGTFNELRSQQEI